MIQEQLLECTLLQEHINAPEAVCIFSNMILEHIWLKMFFQIINGPGPYP